MISAVLRVCQMTNRTRLAALRSYGARLRQEPFCVTIANDQWSANR